MTRLDMDLDEMLESFTREGMKKFVKRLLTASEAEEREMLAKLNKTEKNDLADLDEEMHGKPNTPMVEDDDLSDDGELADVPKKKVKKNG